MSYAEGKSSRSRRWLKPLIVAIVCGLIGAGGFLAYHYFFTPQTVEEKIEARLSFTEDVTEQERTTIETAIAEQAIELEQSAEVSVASGMAQMDESRVIGAYVPVVQAYAVRQTVTMAELKDESISIHVLSDMEDVVKQSLATTLGRDIFSIVSLESIEEIGEKTITFIPVELLDKNLKLLAIDDAYYLDDFSSGGFFREVSYAGEGAYALVDLQLPEPLSEQTVLKTNITGVTALTRVMMRKLNEVKDPLYFSEKIGDFLADADLTHVSNEVSFKDNCTYSNTLFCSPPEFIETLKASGVDLVELTGNHNNDFGAQYNTDTIELYDELGWGTVGGGLNAEDAAEPFYFDLEGTKLAFLAYNYPDSPNGGAIAGTETAGANSFNFDRIEADISAAKENADFVTVNVQYWECYSYPDGYVEFPSCDVPIGEQEPHFKKIADLGADMVVGSSAHQPQTYEIYEGVPIYYGLGNLYFEQTSWPGTERGIVLSNYFYEGKLLQTKLTPTVYDRDLQTRVMTEKEAEYLLTRLHDAR